MAYKFPLMICLAEGHKKEDVSVSELQEWVDRSEKESLEFHFWYNLPGHDDKDGTDRSMAFSVVNGVISPSGLGPCAGTREVPTNVDTTYFCHNQTCNHGVTSRLALIGLEHLTKVAKMRGSAATRDFLRYLDSLQN